MSRAMFLVLLVFVSGCSKSSGTEPGGAASAPAAAESAPALPAASAAAPAAPTPPAEPQASAAAKQVYEAEGIKISELADGRIEVHAKSQWNEPVHQTFADCTYYRNAIPVLERQFTPERAKLLRSACKSK